MRHLTWASDLAECVLAFRERYQRWGVDNLVVLLLWEKRAVSTSMVGRIHAHLKRQGALYDLHPGRRYWHARDENWESSRR